MNTYSSIMSWQQVSPRTTSNNHPYSGVVDTVLARKTTDGNSTNAPLFSNGENVRLSEFGARCLTADVGAPFPVHVAVIVFSGADRQVAEADTRGIVTTVHDMKPFCNRSVSVFVNKAVRADGQSLIGGSGNPELAVTIVSPPTEPNPAFVGLLDVFPEAFKGVASDAGISTWPRTKSACGGGRGERHTAVSAVNSAKTGGMGMDAYTSSRTEASMVGIFARSFPFKWRPALLTSQRDTLGMHDNLRRCCATPQAVAPALGHFVALNYTPRRGVPCLKSQQQPASMSFSRITTCLRDANTSQMVVATPLTSLGICTSQASEATSLLRMPLADGSRCTSWADAQRQDFLNSVRR